MGRKYSQYIYLKTECIQDVYKTPSRIKIQITEQNMDQRFEQIIHNGKYNKWPVNT